MHELLRELTPSGRVLDLGAAAGSFDVSCTRGRVFRIDLEARPAADGAARVIGDAARLPFAGRAFDAVVANHSLEHVERLDDCLREIGRAVRPGGCLFVSVPDASTLTDRIYRWLARGGGHVNPFAADPAALALRIAELTGLPFTAGRTLHTGLSFLNARNARTPMPRRAILFGGGREPVLRAITLALRRIDLWFGTRLSVYGWALYFGPVSDVDTTPLPNVCVRCGSAHDPPPGRAWACPGCGARNFRTGPIPSRDRFL